MKAFVEYTDLYDGESNYSWVIHHEFDCENMTNLQIVRHAKSLLGISGKRANSRSFNGGDMMARYFPYTVMFITFE